MKRGEMVITTGTTMGKTALMRAEIEKALKNGKTVCLSGSLAEEFKGRPGVVVQDKENLVGDNYYPIGMFE